MRILHFTWGLAQGGSENLAVDLANEQCRNHQVMILVANEAIDTVLAGRLHPSIKLLHLKRPEGSRNPLWIIRMLAAINLFRPDVVHSHAHNLAAIGRFIFAPLVLTVHANHIQLSKHSTRFSAICCISRTVEEDVKQRYSQLSPRLVANGVRTSAIAIRNTPPSRPLRAVQVSRLVHATKGQDLLIEALAALNADCDVPIMTIDFIGSGASQAFLQELADKKNLSNSCNFLGAKSREEVFANLQNYDLLVQPSRDEGFGLTVAEGMAAGIPVVVSDLPGPMEVIANGQHGYHFQSDSPEALARTLKAAASDIHGEKLMSRLSAARQFVIDEYDLSHTSESYLRVYEEVTNVR
ncbi:glycosyltransferase family 4 protein [Ferribacterium limneticum]|uniref:glycosyltransferase family 4 protein n=1 Tax=Ferribacterium limneticum TaxID=76259 RepID=UPI001CFB0724|nr:glycosyltransferase family 4 protein [Ferribacterium limneticum]UCV29979.1 glycosyltransferase family 4 protein [Ferribacterium limneticum]UCV33898.1 glycosyltransferase family 4 protein [Ferribacterium limneticum]